MEAGPRIYITHCSAKKAETYRASGESVTPDKLYTAATLQRFIARCSAETVPWAIFSDLYGVWLPEERHTWYEKNPSKVNDAEFELLLASFDARLGGFETVWFYYPGRVHPLHKKLVSASALADRVHLFKHLSEINE